MGRVGSWFALLFLVATALYAPLNVWLETGLLQTLPVLLLGAAMGVLYYLGRVRGIFDPLVIPGFAVAMIAFVYLWFVDGGAAGGAQYFLGTGVLSALAVARGWRRVVITSGMLATGIACFAIQYLHPEWVIVPYHSRGMQFADLCASFVVSIALVGALVIVLAHSYRLALAELDAERAKSERLLENVLPQSVSERLKRAPGVIADALASVTVLFADIVGFTGRASGSTPEELVALLNELFSRFDALSERHGLEKIKTIGDCYMAVAGAPEPCADHAARAAAMALAMLAMVHDSPSLRGVELRIGLHSGPVVAGVIGKKKLSYDLWGDTVNVASRMESHGEPGQIQVTQATRALLPDRFQLAPRGRIALKGRGEMETYLLVGESTAARAG